VTTPHVLREQDGPVAILTFNRPVARNAMTWEMYDALVAWCADVDATAGVRAAVLRGAGGRAFVAGTDIGQFESFATPEDGLAYEHRIDGVIDRLAAVSVPTIAAIDGVATGGGAAIAAACDLRVCSDRSRLGIPIARTLGNCLSAANHRRLLALVGPAVLKELLFTGDLLDAARAQAVGLVNRVLPVEAFDAQVRALAAQIAGNAPLTVRATKEMVRRVAAADGGDVEAGDLIVSCYTSDDFREGVSAFLSKRRPVWTGR